jgi:hypothetical protein
VNNLAIIITTLNHVIAFRSDSPFSNDNDDDHRAPHMGRGLEDSRCQRTRNPTPTDFENETLDDTSAGQAEDKVVNDVGHKFSSSSSTCSHKGTDIFKIKFNDTYDVSTLTLFTRITQVSTSCLKFSSARS